MTCPDPPIDPPSPSIEDYTNSIILKIIWEALLSVHILIDELVDLRSEDKAEFDSRMKSAVGRGYIDTLKAMEDALKAWESEIEWHYRGNIDIDG